MVDTTQKKKILVTGASGFLGTAVSSLLETSQYELVTTNSSLHDLTKLEDCILATKNIDTIIHTAGLVLSRSEQQRRPAEVFAINTQTTLNIAEAARQNGVRRIIFISSVTAYPEKATSPITETDLWNGPVNDGNYAYGNAKRITETIARSYAEQYGLETCVLFLPNLYGPNDKFTYNPPPLIPNSIIQIHAAKEAQKPIIIGGNNGGVELDFLYVVDAAKAVVCAIDAAELPQTVNISTGSTVSIKTIYTTIADKLGYTGTITWEEGNIPPPRRMDTTRAETYLHWQSETEFTEGIAHTVASYLE